MPLAYRGTPPIDVNFLDMTLLPLDKLSHELGPEDMTHLLTCLSTAPWIGRTWMRARLLAAAYKIAAR